MSEKSVLEKIFSFAESTPNKVALVDESNQLTYGELKKAVVQLAEVLQEKNLTGQIVALQIPRTIYYPVMVLALTKVGIPFIPQDISQPKARLAEIIQLAGAKVIVTLEDDKYVFKKISTEDKGSTNAWVIFFTSGSTGTPKGVELPLRNMENTVDWQQEVYGLTAHDRAASFTPYSFEISIIDIFPILCSGGTLYVLSENLRHDLTSLEKYLQKEKITFMNTTATIGEIMMRTMRLPSMRLLTLSGQRFPSMDLSHVPYQIMNVYGNTESGATTVYKIDPKNPKISMGRPVKNIRAFILDNDQQVITDGAVGELFLSGIQVALGYLHNDVATKEAFVTINYHGEMIDGYRTGDFGRIVAGGNIEFLGRRDRQYKINGVRIDLAEVERALRKVVTNLEQCHLAVYKGQIRCWVTSKQQLDEAKIIADMAGILPATMVPTRVKQLPELPINNNGKIDEKVLFKDWDKETVTADVRVLSSELEANEHYLKLAWAEILNINPKSINYTSDFKKLGATSLQIMELGVKILQDLDKKLNFVDLYYHTRLDDMAEYLNRKNQFNPIYTFVERDETMGDAPALFVIHSGNTGSDVYRPLFTNISKPKFPVYVIEPHNLLTTGERIDGIENIAAYYIELIKHFAPEREMDSFNLMGWSYGGVVASEICHQLEVKNGTPKVVKLTILDSPFYLDQADLDEVRKREANGYYTKYFTETHIFEGMDKKNITTEHLIENNRQVCEDLFEYDAKQINTPTIFVRSLVETNPLSDSQIQSIFKNVVIKNVYSRHDYLFVEHDTCSIIQKELQLIS